jgi:hypothetical protein
MYYTNFIEKGLVSIDRLISEINEDNRVSYEDIEDLGIKKPGHIFRIITKLEIDAKLIDDKYSQLVFENKINQSMQLKYSRDNTTCCGFSNDTVIQSEFKSLDLITWLKRINMTHLRKNFVHNGFDSIQYFILQMLSSYPVNDEIVENCLHIYNKKERNTLLESLAKDLNYMNIKLARNINTSMSVLEKESVEEGCKMCNIF